jgi:hypothetical protein
MCQIYGAAVVMYPCVFYSRVRDVYLEYTRSTIDPPTHIYYYIHRVILKVTLPLDLYLAYICLFILSFELLFFNSFK